MEVFEQLLDNILQVQRALPGIVYSAAQNNSESLIDLNVGQLMKGRTSEDKLITPEYTSDDYARLKKALGSQAPLGTPDLILEGDFTGAFYTEQKPGAILIDSRDSKTEDLAGKYENIFGLNNKSRKEFSEIMLSEAIETIENEIIRGL